MKKIITASLDAGQYNATASVGLFLLRLAGGALMLTHGWGKMLKLFGPDPITFADPLGISPEISLALAVLAGVVCAILLIIGLFSRLASIPLIVTMFVAAFIVHAGDPFSKIEFPLLYMAIYLGILLMGAGRYSVDNYISKKQAA